MSNLYRGPSKDDFYQISIHLAKQLQRRRFFRNQPIRNKNCLWWPCLINRSGRNKQFLERTCHRCFLLNFGSFGQVVSEEKISFKSANPKQELSMAAMFVNGSELNEQLLQRTFQGCFLPSFGSFGKASSEEKIFQKSTNQKQELSVAAMFVNC